MKIICSDCGEEKEHQAKGLCQSCYNAHYSENHRDKRQTYNRLYYREHREEILAQKRRYYQENREEKLARQRAYESRHRIEAIERLRRWQRENPEKVAAQKGRYRARKQSLPDTLTGEQAQRILAIGRCFYCEEQFQPGQLALDHFVAVSMGGGTTRANMVAACKSCNSKKGTKRPEDTLGQLILTESPQTIAI